MEIGAAARQPALAGFSVRTVSLDAPRAGEVLARVVAVGVCHTDLAAREGVVPIPLPAVLGHEGAGTVVEVGAGVSTGAPGDKVALSFNSRAELPPDGARRGTTKNTTVGYRISQAEQPLGWSLSADTYALETARLIDRTPRGSDGSPSVRGLVPPGHDFPQTRDTSSHRAAPTLRAMVTTPSPGPRDPADPEGT